MPGRSDARQHSLAARAMERVLRAEQDAESTLERTREQSGQQVQAARDEALAIVNRAMVRVAQWQQAHADRLARRIDALRSEGGAGSGELRAPDRHALKMAARRVAARLTGVGEGGTGEPAR